MINTKEAFFTPVDFKTWERAEHYYYYKDKLKCNYTLNAQIEITELINCLNKTNKRFYPSFIYVCIDIINKIKEFRMDYNSDGVLGYWSYVVPSYTIFHDDNKTFSDIWSEYDEDYELCYNNIVKDIKLYKDIKGVKTKPNQPKNFCPISCIPWISFTSFAQDSTTDSKLLFPIIRFGKFHKENNRILLPISIFVKHAIADGYHTSKLINDIETKCKISSSWML